MKSYDIKNTIDEKPFKRKLMNEKPFKNSKKRKKMKKRWYLFIKVRSVQV